MLDALQQQLHDVYHLDQGYDVRDFLITDPVLAKALGQGAVLGDSEETLLMQQDGNELSLSLFLDHELLNRLESGNPFDELRAESLDDLWKVVEGVSHFSCVAWKAVQDRTVTLLELELQGEIDKYVTAAVLALQQADHSLLGKLHSWLFDNIRFHDDLDEEQRDRYRSANEYAARFCYGLGEQLLEDDASALARLRRFYRLQSSDKISNIHSRTLGQG